MIYDRNSGEYGLRNPGVLLAGVLLVGLVARCSGYDEVTSIDCKASPDGRVFIELDTKQESRVLLGNAVEDSDGDRQWREEIVVDVRGNGEFAVMADGLGPVMHYSEIANGNSWGDLNNTVTGSKVTVTAPQPDDLSQHAPIVVTYHC
ncbi:MAG TPA: hypothetical protein VK978_02245 [Candidatus Saccharimonadales bacterium]|nr:hypothetical protein [Candidatus Saccharimonadales bacterium]